MKPPARLTTNKKKENKQNIQPPARQTSAKLFVGSPCCCCTGGSCRTGTTFSPEEDRSCKRMVLLTVAMRAMKVMMNMPNNK